MCVCVYPCVRVSLCLCVCVCLYVSVSLCVLLFYEMYLYVFVHVRGCPRAFNGPSRAWKDSRSRTKHRTDAEVTSESANDVPSSVPTS